MAHIYKYLRAVQIKAVFVIGSGNLPRIQESKYQLSVLIIGTVPAVKCPLLFKEKPQGIIAHCSAARIHIFDNLRSFKQRIVLGYCNFTLKHRRIAEGNIYISECNA